MQLLVYSNPSLCVQGERSVAMIFFVAMKGWQIFLINEVFFVCELHL